MTLTNRLGQDIFIRLCNEDEPKVLHASDSRISFVSQEAGEPEKLQVSGCLLLHYCKPCMQVLSLSLCMVNLINSRRGTLSSSFLNRNNLVLLSA